MAVLIALGLGALPAAHGLFSQRVTCRVTGDPDARTFTLFQPEAGGEKPWVLSFESKPISPRSIRLTLAGARPSITGSTANLAFKTSNGGIMVDLKATEQKGTLDVYVSYELEVNVDRSMSPDVDLLNTNGSIGVGCQITDRGQ